MKETDKPTVTIGIPAYNEEGNIRFLIKDLLDQDKGEYILEKIIVSSDASEDNTDNIVKTISEENPLVVLIPNNIRQGQAARQNQILENCTSDICILLNADILIEGKDFINSMVFEIVKGADLVCGPLAQIKPTNFFEKILTVGSEIRRHAFEKYKNGINLFTCHGSHRAMTKTFYKEFRFKGSIAEDAYSYLYCIKYGYIYGYAKNAIAKVKLPDNFSDHVRQSSRFFSLNQKLSGEFESRILHSNTNFPIGYLWNELIKELMSKPLESVCYLFVCLYVYLYTKLGLNDPSEKWKQVSSSKVLRG